MLMSMMQVFVLNVVLATETTNAPALFPQRAPNERLYINPTASQPASASIPDQSLRKRERNEIKSTRGTTDQPPSSTATRTLPPSSFIPPTNISLRTSRQHRADPNRRPHNRHFPWRAFSRHAPPSSHGSRRAALNDRRGARAQHAARAIFLVAPHHPSRMAGREDTLAAIAAVGRRRSGSRRPGAVNGGFALAGDVDVGA
jgi:hypothetical protein